MPLLQWRQIHRRSRRSHHLLINFRLATHPPPNMTRALDNADPRKRSSPRRSLPSFVLVHLYGFERRRVGIGKAISAGVVGGGRLAAAATRVASESYHSFV